MALGYKPGGPEFVDWKSTLPFIIPAYAGIQVFFGHAVQAKMDAGPGLSPGQALRRHDKSHLRLEHALRFLEGTRYSNHPRKAH